jgi:hypothetical protein
MGLSSGDSPVLVAHIRSGEWHEIGVVRTALELAPADPELFSSSTAAMFSATTKVEFTLKMTKREFRQMIRMFKHPAQCPKQSVPVKRSKR